jgi:4-hydroxy-3-methylbut-2-enyl diphosphate reductase
MKVLLASPRGFCAGVDRAIDVVESLRAKGAVFVEDPADAPTGALLVFSAHGVSPAVREAAATRGLRVIDATCPLVTKVHVEAQRFAREGFEIVLVGHAGHVEVEGTLGQAPERMHLVETVEDVAKLTVRDPSRLACLTQTTLSVDDTREILAALKARFPAIRLPRKDDICYATQNRQNAVKLLTGEAELVLVVGAPASSNSNRLVEIANRSGARGFLVQTAADIEPAWLAGVRCVAVTAGASAPEVLVQEVVARLRELAGPDSEIAALPLVDEGVAFQLPAELRAAGA